MQKPAEPAKTGRKAAWLYCRFARNSFCLISRHFVIGVPYCELFYFHLLKVFLNIFKFCFVGPVQAQVLRRRHDGTEASGANALRRREGLAYFNHLPGGVFTG